MEIIGQLHAMTTDHFNCRKVSPIPIEYENERAPELVWKLWRGGTLLSLLEIKPQFLRNPAHVLVQSVPITKYFM